MNKTLLKRVIISGTIAFLAYGAWATYANDQYGIWIAIRSGFTQGLLSLFVTVTMTFTVEKTFMWTKNAKFQWLLTAFGPLSLLLGLMALVHWIIGTPEILKTIAPSAIVGTIYCTIYTTGLTKAAARYQTA